MKTMDKPSWPFEDAPATPSVTTTHVTSGAMPITYASRELDEDGEITWQFHCAIPFDMDDAQLVRLDTVANIDGTVNQLAKLPIGFAAKRSSSSEPWIQGNSRET